MSSHHPQARNQLSAVVLAGGLGTRLRSEYASGPKSMAPVAGRPFLDYTLDWLCRSKVSDLVLCVGYMGSPIAERYGDGADWGLRVRYSPEETPLGTAGALKRAERMIEHDTFVVLNGDSMFDTNLGALLEFHQEHLAIATLALAQSPPGARYGSVVIGNHGEIKAFAEKSTAAEAPAECWISGGIYIFSRRVLGLIPADQSCSLEKEIFPTLIGSRFFGMPCAGYFIDIGVPEDYRRAQTELPRLFA